MAKAFQPSNDWR